MASLSPALFSISTRSSQTPRFALKYPGEQNIRWIGIASASLVLLNKPLLNKPWKFNRRGQGNHVLLRNTALFRFSCSCHKSYSSVSSKKWWFSKSCVCMSPSADSVEMLGGNGIFFCKGEDCEIVFNLIDDLVGVLHKSARSFSAAIKRHELVRSNSEITKAWIGQDVNAWHKHIAYQAAAYALLHTITETRFLLPDEHRTDPSPIQNMLSPKTSMLLALIENQLNVRDPRLVQWFKLVNLPLLSGLFIPLLKRWSAEHNKSGVAVVILAISCCVAVRKLGDGRISCPTFTFSVPKIIGQLMDLSHGYVPMDELHHLASEAGLEKEFLSHFGAKVLVNKTSQEVAFWIGVAQKKLAIAFQRESTILKMTGFHSSQLQELEKNLSVLGLFAFLGRSTRLFLLGTGIKDLDEQAKDFLSYLECGGIFIYPELSALPMYQHFMEVIAEEVGWLDFYASVRCISHQDRKRSKQHAIQAEKEIILSAVLSVCSDVLSAFALCNNSTRQSLEPNMVAFVLRSRSMLTVCLENHWAAYYRSSELLKFAERCIPQPVIPLRNQGGINPSAWAKVHGKDGDLMIRGTEALPGCISQSSKCPDSETMDIIRLMQMSCAETSPKCESFFVKYRNKLISASCAIITGTRLLFIDIGIAMLLVLKRIHGNELTKRERKKLTRTLTDFALVIPVTILMLLPISPVGHAALLAAIKKYIPCLIPSSYSSERLGLVNQLNRTKKMEIQPWNNLEDISSMVS